MISKILGAIKRIFGSEADSSEFEEAKTDPGVDSEPSAAAPAPAPTPAPAPSVSEEADEEADTTVDEPEEEARPVVEAPEAAPSEEEAIVVKGVTIAQPAAVLAFANDASEDALKEAGVKGAGLKALLGARPVATAADLGSISGFGKKSIESLVNGAA